MEQSHAPPQALAKPSPSLPQAFQNFHLGVGDHVRVVADVMVVAGRVRYTLEDFDATGKILEVRDGAFTMRTLTPLSHHWIIIEVLVPAIKYMEPA